MITKKIENKWIKIVLIVIMLIIILIIGDFHYGFQYEF